MINKKKYLLALFVFLQLTIGIAKAQTYTIKSLDGATTKINVHEVFSGRQLAVSCAKDTLFLDEFIGIQDVHILKGQFLQIVYNGRGGTGSDIKNTLILSVINSKIIVSMLVTSYASWFSPDPENTNSIDKKGLYKLKFNMTGSDRSSYKLTIAIHDQLSSKLHPQTNYNKNGQVTLSFDPSQNIFYSTHKSIGQSFTLNDPKTQQPGKQKISGTLPIIALGRNSYYYIKGEWYGSGYGNNLFKGYYK